MRSQAIPHVVLGIVILTTILWLDLISVDMLRSVVLFTLAWAGGSTLLVAAAGACIALARSRAGRRA